MKYLRDIRGRVVKAPEYRPSGDASPEGRAAKRRRRQMERKNPPAEVQHAADSSGSPRADRQEIAWVESNPQPDESWVKLRHAPMVIVDDIGEVPPEVWKDAKQRLDDAIARQLAGGVVPVNTAKPRHIGRLGLTRGILAAALLATMGTDKPKE